MQSEKINILTSYHFPQIFLDVPQFSKSHGRTSIDTGQSICVRFRHTTFNDELRRIDSPLTMVSTVGMPKAYNSQWTMCRYKDQQTLDGNSVCNQTTDRLVHTKNVRYKLNLIQIQRVVR